jgi:hypothetical protein
MLKVRRSQSPVHQPIRGQSVQIWTNSNRL